MLSFTINGTTINTNTTKPYVKQGSLKLSPRADYRNDCAFTIITTANIFIPRVGMDLRVLDGAEVLFGGIIKNVRMFRPGKPEGADSAIYVDVMSDGYSDIPQRRTLAPYYDTPTKAGDIVSHYITTVFSEEGITAGTISDGITLAQYIRPVVSGKELLDELADMSGFKWWIDDSKALHFTQEA